MCSRHSFFFCFMSREKSREEKRGKNGWALPPGQERSGYGICTVLYIPTWICLRVLHRVRSTYDTHTHTHTHTHENFPLPSKEEESRLIDYSFMIPTTSVDQDQSDRSGSGMDGWMDGWICTTICSLGWVGWLVGSCVMDICLSP